jgi:hypothetical protein
VSGIGSFPWDGSLVGQSVFVPAHLVGRRKKMGSKVLWVAWNPYPSTGNLALPKGVDTFGSISPTARSLAPHRLPRTSPIPGICHILEMPLLTAPQFLFTLQNLPIHLIPAPISLPILAPTQFHPSLHPSLPPPIHPSIHPSTSSDYSISPSEWESSLGPSMLFGFFGSVDYSMGTLYFTAHIRL